jgi:DNA-binding Lrp family transcriptional regulator
MLAFMQCPFIACFALHSALMDEIDQRIVNLLQANARRSFQDIGRHVALTPPAVKRRVDRLEAGGVIQGYAAIVDPAAIGWPMHAIVSLVCEGRMSAADVGKAVAGHPEVLSAFTVAGEAAAVLHVRARDTAHLEITLERLREASGVIRTHTQVVLSTLLERPVFSPG